MFKYAGHHRRAAAAGAVVTAVMAWGAPAQAGDAVTEWNLRAFEALSAPAASGPAPAPPVQVIHLAMVHAAVFDAVNAIAGGHEPYLEGMPDAPGRASRAAAAIAAARGVLVRMQPALAQAALDKVEAAYLQDLAAIPPGAAKEAGIAAGAEAARRLLAARANDGRYGPFRFSVGTGVGVWRPTATPPVNDPFGWVARVKPFVARSTSQFRTEGPNRVGSDAYLRDFLEVKAVGSATSARTEEQTSVMRVHSGNAVELWNRTFREISEQRGLSLVENARLFALMHLTAADALINTWEDKARWSFWRPITAIRLAADDGDPRTEPNPAWEPAMATPPYPDHPSGYVALSGGMLMAARSALGTDRVAFKVKNVVNNHEIDARSFSEALKDTVRARILLGFHFRTADTQAAALARRVAKYVRRHALQPAG